MKVLCLGYKDSPIVTFLRSSGDDAVATPGKVTLDEIKSYGIDFIISYGYRHIIEKDIIDQFKDHIINLHISLLPWNRGADPNFWSFLENTPKGVTIHCVDEGIDTGPVIAQKEMFFSGKETLSSSYDILQQEILKLFTDSWYFIRKGNVRKAVQPARGTFHRKKDIKEYEFLLEDGYNTPVRKIAEYGKANGLWVMQ